MKRFISVFFMMLILLSSVNVVSFSASAEKADECYRPPAYEAYNETAMLALDTEQAGLREYLSAEIKNCNRLIDLSSYNIPYSQENMDALYDLVFYDICENFHVMYVTGYYNDTVITKLGVTYACDKEQYTSMLSQVEAVAENMVADIKKADLTDVEKALLIHDRIALLCTYDYDYSRSDTEMFESAGIYGAFVEGEVICQGYSRAYKYLLELVGVESYLCVSDELNHMWNIVYIDGKPYHVDVTWDDPASYGVMYNPAGRVNHNNFLLSTEAFVATGHEATDYDSSPCDTTYDSYLWQSSATAFQLLDGEIYYADRVKEQLVCLDTGEELLSIDHTWRAGASSYWRSNFTCLSTDGKTLLYSDSGALYSYNVSTGEVKTVHTAQLTEGSYRYIYGFEYKDGYLVYDVTDNPNFPDAENVERFTVLYDAISPKVVVETTNTVSSSQTLRFTFSDNIGVVGYYFGESQKYSENVYVPTDSQSASVQVSDSGTYYVTAVDGSGNLSVSLGITFYKTTLDPQGGFVTPDFIVSAKGLEVTLPEASLDGHEFMGWSLAGNTEPVTTIIPEDNLTYVALWDKIPAVLTEVQLNSLPEKTQYFEGESLDTAGLSLKLLYSDGTEEIITEGFTVSGFDCAVFGNQTLTVEYEGFGVEFDVNVIKIEPVAVSVITAPSKTEYFEGDLVDTSGLVLSVTYNNGEVEITDSGYTVDNPVLSAEGETEVAITYSGLSASFTVNVLKIAPVKISINTYPEKTDYYVGNSLDTKGLTITVEYNNGSTEIMDSGFDLSGFDSSAAGTKTVTVSYCGLTDSFEVNVKAPQVVSIKIVKLPDKTEYLIGESLDLTGLELEAYYDSGIVSPVNANFGVQETVFCVAGKNTVTLTISGIKVSFDVNVSQPTEATEPIIIIKPTEPVIVTKPTLATDPTEETKPSVVIPEESKPVASTPVETDPEETTKATVTTATSAISTEATEPSESSSAVATETSTAATEATDASTTASASTEPSSTASEDECKIGDANLDGKINIKDATIVQKFLAKMTSLEDKSLKAADANRDERITIKDATAIQKFIAGLLDRL